MDSQYRLLLCSTLFAAGMAYATSAHSGEVTVSFVQPERFTDVADNDTRSPESIQRNLDKFTKYFSELGGRYLQADEQLTIKVLDIDLAGQYEPWRRNDDHERYYRETTWPTIRLEYVLTLGGKEQKKATETVNDNEYRLLPNALPESDVLRYEKRMLDKWFEQRFGGE